MSWDITVGVGGIIGIEPNPEENKSTSEAKKNAKIRKKEYDDRKMKRDDLPGLNENLLCPI